MSLVRQLLVLIQWWMRSDELAICRCPITSHSNDSEATELQCWIASHAIVMIQSEVISVVGKWAYGNSKWLNISLTMNSRICFAALGCWDLSALQASSNSQSLSLTNQSLFHYSSCTPDLLWFAFHRNFSDTCLCRSSQSSIFVCFINCLLASCLKPVLDWKKLE